MSIEESFVEDAALEWFGELGCAVGHGPHLVLGEASTKRDAFGEVVLAGRSSETLLQKLLNSELSVVAEESTIAAAS